MISATSLIAEIGTDMSYFETANHVASWSGLKPRNDQSNKIVKSLRITHGNRYLRRTIIQYSWAAGRTKDCCFSRLSYYQTQVRKKNKMKVQVASQSLRTNNSMFIKKNNCNFWLYLPYFLNL